MDDLIHCTSHTLQLLIEYDPVRQRLDGLRLGSPRTSLRAPATSRMRLSSPSNAVLEKTEPVEDGLLKRRSLRYINNQTRTFYRICVMSILIINPTLLIPGAVTAYASHLGPILQKNHLSSHETSGARNHCDPPAAVHIASSGHVTSFTERSWEKASLDRRLKSVPNCSFFTL